MRILVLNYEFPPIGGGGGRASADLADELAARGHMVRVVTTGIGRGGSETVASGVSVIRLRTGRRSPSSASFGDMFRYLTLAAWRATREARSWPADVVHAHFAVPTGAAAWACSQLSRRPYVLTVHLGDIPGGVPEKTSRWFRWVRGLTPPIWSGAAEVVAVSEYSRGLGTRAYGRIPVVIPNGVDLRRRAETPRPVGTPVHIVFVGRFQPQKNLGLLVDLLASLRDLPWTATLVGDGPLWDGVGEQVRREGLADRIRLTGWLPSDQAEAELSRGDVLLMPSLVEGLPVVGLQALAHGLAIIGSRVGGLSELIVEGQNGYGLAPEDAQGFRRALESSLRNPGRLAGMKQASHALAQRFDLRAVAEAYERLFQRVVAA